MWPLETIFSFKPNHTENQVIALHFIPLIIGITFAIIGNTFAFIFIYVHYIIHHLSISLSIYSATDIACMEVKQLNHSARANKDLHREHL